MLRLAFFGSDEIALPCLNALANTHAGQVEIVCVYSQPDRPHGRGQKLRPNAVVAWARARNIPVFQPEKIGETDEARIREFRCDAALVMAYGHILKNTMLAAAPLGFFNLHASLLPALRGATPIEGAIISGLEKTGVTLQRVVAKLDAGAVIDAEEIPLSPTETRLTLREKVAAACVPLIARALPKIISGDAGTPQDETRVTFTRKITRDDSAMDFSLPARELAARVRALSPWPGTVFPFGENLVLKTGEALAESAGDSAAAPGTILSADAKGICIATGSGTLRVTQLQRPGGKMLPAAAFLAGFPIAAGTEIESKKAKSCCAFIKHPDNNGRTQPQAN